MVRSGEGEVGVITSPVVSGWAAVLGLIQGSWGWAGVWWRRLPIVTLGVASWSPVKLGLSWGEGGRGVLEGLTA